MRFDRRHEAQLAIERFNGQIPVFQTGTDGSNISEPLTVRYAKFWVSLDAIQPPIQSFFSPVRIAPIDHGLLGIPERISTTASNNYQISLNEASSYEFKPITTVFSTDSVQNLPMTLANAHVQPSIISTCTDMTQIKTISNVQATAAFYQSQLTSNIGWRICVRNLPVDAQETLLWELFGPFGAVLNVRIMRTYNNNNSNYGPKSQGGCIGYVTMTMVDEANKAILALDGYTIANRTIQVYLATNHDFF